MKPLSTPLAHALSASLIATVLWAAGAPAQERPFCLDTEPLAPNGIVLRMGREYYRTCGTWNENAWRQFRLDMNPDLIPDLFSRYTPTNMVLRAWSDALNQMQFDNLTKSQPRKGKRTFGGIVYQGHQSEAVGPNGQPNTGTYVYVPKDEKDDIPGHFIACAGQGSVGVDQGGTFNCTIFVDYKGVQADLVFIGSKERGYTFTEHFADFARDMIKVLDVANVTDRLDEMKGFVDIVD